MGGALEGVRVLELARFQAGPRGGMILSDLGAEVIKIEKLGGEETRQSPPLVRGQSVYFSVYNRGKKSLCLDLRAERGKEVFAALVETADIVLQNFRPGVMDKMGFGYDRLRQLKPDIILGSVSQPVVAEPHLVHDPGPEVLQDDVGGLDQCREDPLAALGAQIEAEALLAAVVDREIDALAAHQGRGFARLLAAQFLDLDDLGAEVGEDHAAARAGLKPRQFEHPDTVESPAHHHPPFMITHWG